MPAAKLLSIVDPSLGKNQATGIVASELALEGNAPDLRPSGKIVLSNISVPKFNLADLSGTISMPQTRPGQSTSMLGTVELPRLKLGNTQAENLQAKLTIEPTAEHDQEALLKIADGHLQVAGGEAAWTGTIDLNHRVLSLKGKFDKLRAADLCEQFFTRAGEITGTGPRHI